MINELLDKAKQELDRAERAEQEHKQTAARVGGRAAEIHAEAAKYYRDKAKELAGEIEFVQKRLQMTGQIKSRNSA